MQNILLAQYNILIFYISLQKENMWFCFIGIYDDKRKILTCVFEGVCVFLFWWLQVDGAFRCPSGWRGRGHNRSSSHSTSATPHHHLHHHRHQHQHQHHHYPPPPSDAVLVRSSPSSASDYETTGHFIQHASEFSSKPACGESCSVRAWQIIFFSLSLFL